MKLVFVFIIKKKKKDNSSESLTKEGNIIHSENRHHDTKDFYLFFRLRFSFFFFIFKFLYLARSHSIWDLTSPTRDQNLCFLQWKLSVLTTERPRNSPKE